MTDLWDPNDFLSALYEGIIPPCLIQIQAEDLDRLVSAAVIKRGQDFIGTVGIFKMVLYGPHGAIHFRREPVDTDG